VAVGPLPSPASIPWAVLAARFLFACELVSRLSFHFEKPQKLEGRCSPLSEATFERGAARYRPQRLLVEKTNAQPTRRSEDRLLTPQLIRKLRLC